MPNQTQVTVKQKVDSLKKMLDAQSVQDQFKAALKDNAPGFMTGIIDLYNTDSYLQGCEPKEVIMEALKAAILKLPINKSLGFAYIVPFKQQGVQKPQFQLGYKGYIQLAMRTGQYKVINADSVLEGEFKKKDKLTGSFDLSGEATSDKVIGYFAHIEMLNGFSKTLYMTKDQVENHAKKYSKSYNSNSSPWKTEFDAMAIKTVIRNLLSHYGFLSIEMMSAMSTDVEGDTVTQNIQEDIAHNANSEKLSFEDAQVVNMDTGEVMDQMPDAFNV